MQGMAVQAASGASRKDLRAIANTALRAWPERQANHPVTLRRPRCWTHELWGLDLTVSVSTMVPPCQARTFKEPVWFSDMPTAKKMVWNYKLLKVKGSGQ
jgi:hypothetical protein